MTHQADLLRERAFDLLIRNIPNVTIASALGVSPALISEMMADEEFAAEVALQRFESLQVTAGLDAKYDKIENTLVSKLDLMANTIVKPREIVSALKVINGANRRSSISASTSVSGDRVVNLQMPIVIQNKYNVTVNASNQIVEVEDDRGRPNSLVAADARSLDSFSKPLNNRQPLLINQKVTGSGQVKSTKVKGQIAASDL